MAQMGHHTLDTFWRQRRHQKRHLFIYNSPRSIYFNIKNSNMTPRLKVQNCKFFMAPFTQFPEETWAQRIQNQILKESLGAKSDFIISNVGYSLKNVKCRRITRELVTRSPHSSKEREGKIRRPLITSSIKCEIHVLVLQGRQRNVQKSVMHA